MKKFAISLCTVCLLAAGVAAQKQGGDKASFEKFVQDSIKATTDNDAKWMQANLADSYVEGTSFGSWISKAQLIKDAGDPANNKFSKNDVSDMQTQIVGNVGLARFKES